MRFRGLVLLVALVLAAGCQVELPEPESPGARLYAERCGGCHRLYAPKVLTAAMWKVMVQRMQQEMLRRRVPTTPRERGDPSTEELLGTLGPDVQYNRGVPGDISTGVGMPDPTSRQGVWTLQIGAFGSETGALVRVRELQHRFPDLPAWRVKGRDGLVRVYLGRFQDESAGEPARERVRAAGYPDAWVVRAP